MDKSLIFGERSLTLVGADFPDRSSALRAQRLLKGEASLDGEVAVIGPDDPLAARKLEPEQAGIFKTALRSLVVLGAVGGAIGAGVAVALAAAGWPAAAGSLGYAVLFMSAFGSYVGMLLAGVVTLRPDHAYVIRRMRDAMARRRWAVVVRPLSRSLAKVAATRLRRMGATPRTSL
jgi:hypothetical protein